MNCLTEICSSLSEGVHFIERRDNLNEGIVTLTNKDGLFHKFELKLKYQPKQNDWQYDGWRIVGDKLS